MADFEVARPDGAVLRGQAEGVGPDLLLISGLGGAAAFWNPVVAALADRFRLIRFDQRGIGASTRGTGQVDIASLAADASAVLHALARGPAVLVGHSTGGCIIQEMALASPDGIAGLALTGTWARPNRYMTELFRSRLALLRAAPRDYAAQAAFMFYTPDWLDRNWSAFEAAVTAAPLAPAQQDVVAERIEALLAFDRGRDLARLETPAAIIGAEDDLIVPAFLQRELAGLLPGASLDILDRGGHFFPVSRLEDFTAWLERAVRRFGT